MLRRMSAVVTFLVAISMVCTPFVNAQDFATPVVDPVTTVEATPDGEGESDLTGLDGNTDTDNDTNSDTDDDGNSGDTSGEVDDTGTGESETLDEISPASSDMRISPMSASDDVGWITVDPMAIPPREYSMTVEFRGEDGTFSLSAYQWEEAQAVEVPVGTYHWVARAGYGAYQDISGDLVVEAGETYTVPDSVFVLHPALQFQVVDQNSVPVPDISVTVRHADDSYYRGGTSDNAGVIRVNVPYGDLTYEFSAAAVWDLPAGGSLVFDANTTTIPVQVSSAPSGTMAVNLDFDDDRYLEGEIGLETTDGRFVDSVRIQTGQHTYLFENVPVNRDYILRVWSWSGWYQDYEATHHFAEGVPIDIALSALNPVQVEIVASSTTSGVPLRTSYNASVYTQEGGRFVDHVELAPQADGTLRGTAVMPKTPLWIYDNYDSNYQTGLPFYFDPSAAGASGYRVDLAFTPIPGWVFVDVTAPEGLPVSGGMYIYKDGASDWDSYIAFGPSAGTFTTHRPLSPGDYTWSYDGGGIFAPQSGAFTIDDADIYLALDLVLGANGVIVLHPQLAGDYPDESWYGRVVVDGADGTTVRSVWGVDLRYPIALGPMQFGEYTIDIVPNGLPWQEVADISVTVDQLEVNVEVPIPNYERIDLTFELYGDGGPVIGEVVLCQYDYGHGSECGNENGGDSYTLDENGTAVIEDAWNRTSGYFFRTANYDSYDLGGYWTPGDANPVRINLGTEWHRVNIHVEDANGGPVSGMGGISGSCQVGYPRSGGESEPGVYTAWVNGRSNWCELYLYSSSDGVYPFTSIDTVYLDDGNETDVYVTVERDPTTIENVTFQVEFVDQPAPTGDFYLRLSGSGGPYISVGSALDQDHRTTIARMLPGVYQVEVLERDPDGYKGIGDWYVGVPAFVTITEGNQTVTLQVVRDVSVAPTPENAIPVTITGKTRNGDALSLPVDVAILDEQDRYYWSDGQFTGSGFTELPPGTYRLSVQPSNLYRQQSMVFTISESDTQKEIVFVLDPVQAIPVGPITASLGQAEGPVGTSVHVLGGGFRARESVQIRWGDGTVLATGAASTNGEFDIAVTIPATAPGAYQITVVGSISGTTSALMFTVTEPFMNVLLVSAVCEGYVDMTLDTDYVGLAFIKLYANNGGDPVRLFDVNGSGTYTVFFAQFTSGDPQYSILPASYEIAFGQPVEVAATDGIGVIDMDCSSLEVTPTPTEVPTETPTEVPTETPTEVPTETPTEVPTEVPTETPTEAPTEEPEGEHMLIVHFDLPGDADISGAPWQLFAPTAAQFLAAPIQTGVVGANNTIVIDGLLPGKYRLVVTPEGMAEIAVVIQIGDAAVTEVLIQKDENGEITVHYLDVIPPTVEPTPTEPGSSEGVTGLPSTGSGHVSSQLLAMIVAAAVLSLVIPAGIIRPVRRKQ